MKDNTYLNSKPEASKDLTDYKKISFYTPPDVIEREAQNEILSNLFLTWTGCYTKAYGHVVNNRLLQDHVIIYCVDGFGWLELDGRHWSVKKGDVFMCPPDIPHSYGADGKAPWTKYWIHFRGKNSNAYMDMLGLTLASPVLHIGDNAKILSWLQDIFNVLKTGYTHSNLLFATSYLMNILSYMNSMTLNKGFNKAEDINVEKIISYMLDNADGNLSLDQLSHFSGVSKYYFVRLFREKTGYTPVDYFIRLKIQKACELLESSPAKINNISAALGFNNPYYFSIAFKRIMGQAPQYYRQMVHYTASGYSGE